MTNSAAADPPSLVGARLDAADLTNLPTEELVPTLLRGLREERATDVAAVLAVDGSGTQLIAHSSVGLDDGNPQGFRLPIGAAFLGGIASTGQPAVLLDVNSSTVADRRLVEGGIRQLAGVPLHNAEQLIGVLYIGARDRTPFDDADLDRLREIGELIATALATDREDDERRAAQMMQRSLLPTRLPNLAGFEFAARFVPASGLGVGGDWYDAFTLPGDRLVVAVGDVVGHGLPAAVVMGRMRSVVRAYAFECDDPSEIIHRVARKFAHFEPSAMASLLVAQISPPGDEAVIASAGHPPPVLAPPDDDPSFVALTPGPPVGFPTDEASPCTRVAIAPGATLVCFTDGLFERRDTPLDDSLERLRWAVRPGPVEPAVSAVMTTMIGRELVADDTAVIAVRRLPGSTSNPTTPRGAGDGPAR